MLRKLGGAYMKKIGIRILASKCTLPEVGWELWRISVNENTKEGALLNWKET
jgi:hypothetical protein